MNPMKLSHLLAQRPELLRRIRLANLAFAYQTLGEFAERVARASLQGRVTLKPINPDEECYCVTLTAIDVNQSLIEEHFSDEDLTVLADVLGFATGHPAHELTFYIDQLDEFVAQLRNDLEHAGVAFDEHPRRVRARRDSE
jgi:hypothetical protein